MSAVSQTCRSLAAAAVLLGALPVAAEPLEEAIRFQYRAPPECPDVTSFTGRVRVRTARGRNASPEELARTFEVRIEPGDKGFVGSIEFLDDGGARVSRRVAGEQCEPVVDSLALIAALAVDTNLRSDEDPALAAEPSPSSPLSSPPLASSPASAPASSPAVPKAQVAISSTRRSEPWLSSARLGLTGGYDTMLDALSLGPLGQLDFRADFSFRLAAHLATTTATVDAGRSADLRLLGLTSSGCYVALREQGLALSACAWLDLGTLRAEGQKSEQLTKPATKTVFWGSLGPELRLAWDAAGPVWLELSGNLGFPLVAGRRFEFRRPDAKVFEVPRVTSTAAVTAGVRFW